MDKVTIVIPAYNVENYIGSAIESVLAQTYDNWELIIVNDGSTDNTESIITSYLKKDARIQLVSQENQGVSVARNRGLDLALGKYISFLDGDDWYDPRYIELMVKPLLAGKAEITFCKFQELDQQNVVSQTSEIAEQRFKGSFIDYISNTDEILIANMALMYSVDCLRLHQIRFTPGCSYAEDSEFVIKSAYLMRIFFVPDFLYFYVVRKGSASRQGYSYQKFFGELNAYLRVENFVLEHPKAEQQKYLLHLNNRILVAKNRIKRKPWRALKKGRFQEVSDFLEQYETLYNKSYKIAFKEIDSKKFWFKVNILRTKNKWLWKLVSLI